MPKWSWVVSMRKFNADFKRVVCYNIRKYRKQSGMSVMQVSEIIGVTPEYFKRIESLNDPRKNCSLTLLYKLSILFNKNLDDFFIEDGLENKEDKRTTNV